MNKTSVAVDMLILGAGWSSRFLIPLLENEKISYAASSTTGRDNTIKFKFECDPPDPTADQNQYANLPFAKTILITFPIRGSKASTHLVNSYIQHHLVMCEKTTTKPFWIQLGSTGIYEIQDQDTWVTRNSRYNTENERAVAEDELLNLGGCVLNLAGLWGHDRHPANWIKRVAKNKGECANKKSLHLIHGEDVSHAIVAVHRDHHHGLGQRYMITNLLVYDWWEIILAQGGQLDCQNNNQEFYQTYIKWIGELMREHNVRALPRSMEQLGRCYDSREFWATFGIMPMHSRL